MFKKISIFLCCFTLFASILPACATDIVDRIVATVNGHIILQSDWEDEIRYEAFINGHTLSTLTQAKMNQLLTAWLKDLRAGSEIHMDGFSPPEGRRNE